MKYIVTLNGKDYEVEVSQGTADVLSIKDSSVLQTTSPSAAGAAVPATVAPEEKVQKTTTATQGGQAVEAPIPGTVVRIVVKQGDLVKNGDVLMIIEAMKMENEIFSPCDGTVAEIAVTAGGAVNNGELLAVIA